MTLIRKDQAGNAYGQTSALAYHPQKGLALPRGPFPGENKYRVVLLAGLRMSKAGQVAIKASSDDGCRIYLDDKLILDNWGVHPLESKSRALPLAKGAHILRLDYFQAGGKAGLFFTASSLGVQGLSIHPLDRQFRLEDWRAIKRKEREALAWMWVALCLAGVAALWPLLSRAAVFSWRKFALWGGGHDFVPLPDLPYAPWKKGNRAAWLSYLLLTLVFTYPWVTDMATSTPSEFLWRIHPRSGHYSDHFIFMWNAWWMGEAITSLKNPFFCDLIYWPAGASLAWHTLSPALAAPAGLLMQFLKPVPAYNTVLLLAFAFCGYNAFYAARGLVGGFWPAWVAGFIFAFNPYHMGKALSQMNLFGYLWLPMFAYALIRAAQAGGTRRWLAVGLWACLSFYSGFYQALFCLVFALFFVAAGSRAWQAPLWNRRALLGLGTAVLLAAAAACPLLLQMMQDKMANGGTIALQKLPPMDWRLLFTFPLMHPWFDFRTTYVLAPNFTFYWHHYLGWTLPALALLSLFNRPGRRKVFFFMGLTALATWLTLNPGHSASRALQTLHFPDDFRGFDSFWSLAMLGTSFLAAYACQVIFLRGGSGGRPRQWWALLAILPAMIFEFWCVPFPTYQHRPPEQYRRIAADPRQFTVLELPLALGKKWIGPDEFHYFQTMDGHARLGHNISRMPAGLHHYYINNYPALENLNRGRLNEDNHLADTLDKLHVAYVVANRKYWPQEKRLKLWAKTHDWQAMGSSGDYIFFRRPLPSPSGTPRPASRAGGAPPRDHANGAGLGG